MNGTSSCPSLGIKPTRAFAMDGIFPCPKMLRGVQTCGILTPSTAQTFAMDGNWLTNGRSQGLLAYWTNPKRTTSWTNAFIDSDLINNKFFEVALNLDDDGTFECLIEETCNKITQWQRLHHSENAASSWRMQNA